MILDQIAAGAAGCCRALPDHWSQNLSNEHKWFQINRILVESKQNIAESSRSSQNVIKIFAESYQNLNGVATESWQNLSRIYWYPCRNPATS